MATNGEGGAQEGDNQEKDKEYQRLSRRRIYFNRLIGDDVNVPKVKTQRRDPLQSVMYFLLYAILANGVIRGRSDVETLSAVNMAISTSLTEVPWTTSPRPKYLKDIASTQDILEYVRNVLLPEAMIRARYTYNSSYMSYNRLVPSMGVCLQDANVVMTFRRVKLTTEHKSTTTERFAPLYPETWYDYRGAIGDGEDKTTIRTSYPYEAGDTVIPTKQLGTDKYNNLLDTANLIPGNPVFTEFAYTPRCKYEDDETCVNNGGYKSEGGYVAYLIISHEHNEVFVALTDNSLDPLNDSTVGLCDPGLRVSNILRLEDFARAGYLDGHSAKIVIEFTTYNANHQVLASVEILFQIHGSGIPQGTEVSLTPVKTIKLDTASSFMKYFESFYALVTVSFLFHLGYRCYRNWPVSLQSLWTWINAASIICSLLSLAWWYAHDRALYKFLVEDDFRWSSKLQERQKAFKVYANVSSFATLTIWMRVIEHLANTKARVKLLELTLGTAARNMFVYISYVGVFFLGFSAFAMTHFASYTPNYSTPLRAFVSCFTMFLGQISPLDDVTTPLKPFFIMVFMVFFFFISVQMFNAIVNYSYNLMCDDMEPTIQKERSEKKRKENRRKQMINEQTFWERLMIMDFCMKRGKKQEGKDVAGKQAGANDKNTKSATTNAAIFDNLESSVKEKVEAFMDKDKNRKAPDGITSMCAFLIFACAYIVFLIENLAIPANSTFRAALSQEVSEKEALSQRGERGDMTVQINLSSVNHLRDMADWTVNALPTILFNGTSEKTQQMAVRDGWRTAGTVCIANWNCIVNISQVPGGKTKIARITQRRAKLYANNGAVSTTNSTNRFIGGLTANGQDVSAVLLPSRRSHKSLKSSDTSQTVIEDTSPFSLSLDTDEGTHEFCKRQAEGVGQGYQGHGGIECLLDADPELFKQQVLTMNTSDFFSLSTAALAVEFVAYNPNRNMILYTTVLFTVLPSGLVESSMLLSSFIIFDIDDFEDNPMDVVGKLAPGFVYMALVGYFSLVLYLDARAEIKRKNVIEGKHWIVVLVEFFTLDIFNMLELFSISISLVSFVIFVVWVFLDRMLADELKKPFSEFVQYVGSLAVISRLYSRLSSLNMLIIFIRPLKFGRSNPRMAQLNKTLFDARVDVFWFVIMLFITMVGFVMFAHISFGPSIPELSSIDGSVRYCFYYILGLFDFWPLYYADRVMAFIFFFPYLILFYCVFTNIFFAIIDRFFIGADPGPVNCRKRLKPLFGRCIRWVEWDEDYQMEEDPNAKQSSGPQTRSGRVHQTAKKIQEIRQNAHENVMTVTPSAKSRNLGDVCDTDDRMADVLHWSRGEAKAFVNKCQKWLAKKQETKNEENFINQEVMPQVKQEEEQEEKEMETAKRHKRYAIQINEQMAMRDQETLAKYVQLLEKKIKSKTAEKQALRNQVEHFRIESDKMRYTKEEITKKENPEAQARAKGEDASHEAQIADQEVNEEESDDGSEDSDTKQKALPAPAQEGDDHKAKARGAMLESLSEFAR